MAKTFKLTILSAERELYSGDAEALTISTEMGEITAMADHRPLVANLEPGELKIQKPGNQTDWMFVGGGVLEFTPANKCRVLADVAERVEEIDEKRAEEARERAKKSLEAAKSEPEVAEAKVALLKALARIRIAEKNRRLRGRR
ncbi:ATP synthase F1 subunit epsilon [Patescibacteria group bacterium]|nr:ATP synthase F1 subunit epsilon [Patescibacteria group bacterium]